MRSKFLAGAAALAIVGGALLTSSAPASAWGRNYARAPAAAAGALVGGAIAAATSPFWWGNGYGYYPGYTYPRSYGYYGDYAYNPGIGWWGWGSNGPYGGGGTYSWNNGSYGYAPGYVTPNSGVRDDAYCARRYRSYDPASGTYLGYDGVRHACP